MSIVDRIQRGWNAFMNKDPTSPTRGPVSSSRPDRRRLYGGNDKSIVNKKENVERENNRVLIEINSRVQNSVREHKKDPSR